MKLMILAAALLASSCSDDAVSSAGAAAPSVETKMDTTPAAGAPVAGLPFAGEQTFAPLDEYLAFLKKAGEYDTPWYRELKPGLGIYERVTRMPRGQRSQTFTRAELMKKYGFSS